LVAPNGLSTACTTRDTRPITSLVASGGFGFNGVLATDVVVNGNEAFTTLARTGVVSASPGSVEPTVDG
jgi:hypothetical protein